jgi:uncharacterized membrane protein HdeD (DUF308 family)
MTTPEETSVSPENSSEGVPSRMRVRLGVFMALFGLLVFFIGARPALFGLDRSPVIGFVQISVFLVGLAIICIGGYIGLMAFWKNGNRTIAADIGLRLVATGYVVAVVAGMADVFGFGTQVPPQIPRFGSLQALGVQIGEALIIVGFLLLVPYRGQKREEQSA